MNHLIDQGMRTAKVDKLNFYLCLKMKVKGFIRPSFKTCTALI